MPHLPDPHDLSRKIWASLPTTVLVLGLAWVSWLVVASPSLTPETPSTAESGIPAQVEIAPNAANRSPQQIALLKWYTAINTTQSNFTVGDSPQAIAFDGENLWTANYEGTVSVIRASTGELVRTIAVEGILIDIAFDGAYMWVLDGAGDILHVIRASDGERVATYPNDQDINNLAFDGTKMWAVGGQGTLSALDASDGHVMDTYSFVGNGPNAIAFDGSKIWVTSYEAGNTNVDVFRASDGAHLMSLTAGNGGDGARGLAFDGKRMWVADEADNKVTIFRASDGAQVANLNVASPSYLAFDGAQMWVTSSALNTVTVFGMTGGALSQAFPTGAYPREIAFDGANMWIVNSSENTVSKR
jgi:DNA-binding beta-propeller fold protein YncE